MAALLCLLSLLLPLSSYASNVRFSHLTTDDGLSQMTVNDLLQDRQGYIWVATQDGLNRYDGYKFKVFRHDADDERSLADNRIYDLFEDKDGTLWVGTGGGLHRYDAKLECFERFVFKIGQDNSISGNMVVSISQDLNGHLWIASYIGGVARMDIEQRRFVQMPVQTQYSPGLISNKVVDIEVDSYGDVWMATNGKGVSRYLSKTSQFEHFFQHLGDSGLSSNLVKHVVETTDGKILVSTLRDGVNVFERRSKTFSPVKLADKTFSLSNMLAASDGNLWMGSIQNGLFRRRLNSQDGIGSGKTLQFSHDATDRYSLSSENVLALMEDNSGVIWVGTHGGGISTYNTAMARFKHYKHHPLKRNNLPNNGVWSLFEDNRGGVWIATRASGVSRLDLRSEKITRFIPTAIDGASGLDFSRMTVLSVFQDSAGVMWFGTNNNGLFSFDETKRQFKHYAYDERNSNSLVNDIRVSAIVEDKQKRLWIATGGGLSRLDKSRQTFTNFVVGDGSYLGSNIVQTLFVDAKGDLWVGHYNDGIDRFDADIERFSSFRHEPLNRNSLSNDTVFSIYQTANGVMWFGTNGGLNRYDESVDEFRHYKVSSGLSNETVMGVMEDKLGYLWLTTNLGLNRFEPDSEQFKHFYFRDGIQHNEFSSGAYYVTRSGLVMVGGVNGFNVFNPAGIDVESSAPQVVFTEFLINNQAVDMVKAEGKSVNFVDEVALEYSDNVFAIGFSALSYINPKQNQFRYRLVGFDKHWIEVDATHRRATYTNLDPGRYVFRVTASNANDVWQSDWRELTIVIAPASWQSLWAYMIYWAIAAALLLFVILMRYKKVKVERIAAAQLANSEKQLRLALWGSGDQLWDWNVGKRVIERKNIMLGFDLPLVQSTDKLEACGLNIHPEDQAKFDMAMSEHLQGSNEYFECKFRLKDAKGQWRWVLDRGKVFETDKRGQPLRITGTMQDVHDIHIAQETLTVLNESLERQVAGRTKALQNSLDQLKAAQSHIIEAEKMASLGTLVAGVAHEVNTPLGICITMMSTLIDKLHELNERFDTGKVTRQFMEHYLTETAQCQELVDGNLLRAAQLVQSFKQVAVDQSEDNPVDMLFADYLTDIVRTMRPKLLNRHIELQVDVAGEWIINTYPSAWWQLITNLIENSCAHGFFNQPKGKIDICATLDNKNHLKLIYTDDGVGMNENTLKQIYDPFYTTARNRNHIGLGMHIVYNLVVQKLGGTIDCHSVQGHGMEIYIEVFVG